MILKRIFGIILIIGAVGGILLSLTGLVGIWRFRPVVTKTVVENLQSTRSDVVHLLDQMLRILPDGVYLKSLRQTGYKISMVGYAQSSARVSTLMRSIEDSPWLDTPTLIEVHATSEGGRRQSEFSLNFNLTKQATPAAAAPAMPANKG